MSHFNHWKNEHADMPEKAEDGTWHDLEDGLAYDANADYGYNAKPQLSDKQKAIRQISLDKATKSRKLAKFYGGKALKGSAKQKSWAEAVREGVLSSTSLNDEQKESLVQCGGFTDKASFWIDNKDLNHSKFTAENIVAQYSGLAELESAFSNDRSNYTSDIERHISGIVKYMNDCDFNFKTSLDRVQRELDKIEQTARSAGRRESFNRRR